MQFIQALLTFVEPYLLVATTMAAPATFTTRMDIRGRNCTTYCNPGTWGPDQYVYNQVRSSYLKLSPRSDCDNAASILTGSSGPRSFTVAARKSNPQHNIVLFLFLLFSSKTIFTYKIGSCLTSLQDFHYFDVIYDTNDYGALANTIAASCNGGSGGSYHFDRLNDQSTFI